MTNVTAKTLAHQAEREKAINKTRKKLIECREDMNAFMAMYPDHTEAKRLYDQQIAKLTADLDALIRS